MNVPFSRHNVRDRYKKDDPEKKGGSAVKGSVRDFLVAFLTALAAFGVPALAVTLYLTANYL